MPPKCLSFFDSFFEKLYADDTLDAPLYLKHGISENDIKHLACQIFATEVLYEAIDTMKPNKSCGDDNLVAEMLCSCSNVFG